MNNAQMIHGNHNTNKNPLYIAFDLSDATWKTVSGNGIKKRQKNIAARDTKALEAEIARAKQKFGMSEDVEIYSCYEAGRDGFWLHRFLESIGITSLVVDSSSIEVTRRKRRAKTDRIDAVKLYEMLIRYVEGERKAWSVVYVPKPEQEDARRLYRERQRLKKERTAHTNRIKSLLILQGVRMQIGRSFLQDLEQVRLWNDQHLPEHVQQEILREHSRYQLVVEQLKALEQDKQVQVSAGTEPARQIKALERLRGVGPVSSWALVIEFFGWRRFRNVKQVGAAAGLAPTPHSSGNMETELGISKAGNPRIRCLMVELAWGWLRYQGQSSLSQWYQKRFGMGGKRMRRIGIVALARKLLVALWKYLEAGLVPDGARLKV
ncbi:IS110 family transposase [Thermodesulfobacteriota bacterium]